MASTHHLTTKLAAIMAEQQPSSSSFGALRDALGRHRVMLLPNVKHHHEVTLPHSKDPEQARATVVLELTLLDTESDEQLVTRWIGQATDLPGLATERAITRGMEDFLQKTFLLSTPQPTPAPHETPVRRRPQGAPLASPSAQPQLNLSTPQEPPTTPAPAPTTQNATQLTLLDLQAQEVADQAVNEAVTPAPLPPLTEAWKASNALWRALVSEVVCAEVMDAFEDALERQHEVDSWRRLTPEQIRVVCHHLRKRTSLAPDVRKLSDREEYILSQLSLIPAGSSLNRLEEELHRLLDSALTRQQRDAFMQLYLQRMNASSLSEIPGRAAIALCRKLRRMSEAERLAFAQQALEQADQSSAA